MSGDKDYVCTLHSSCIKKAKAELNENPEDRLAAVQALRDWIEEQPHIKCPMTGTKMLLRFLRGAKFSQVRARSLLEGYLNLRQRAPKLFLDVDSHDPGIKVVLETGFFAILPKREPTDVQVIFLRPYKVEKMKINVVNFMRTMTLLFEFISLSENTQVNGSAVLVDMSGTTATLLSKFFTGDALNWQKMWFGNIAMTSSSSFYNYQYMNCPENNKKNTPGRQKGIHHYRAGVLLEIVTSISKTFMPKKLMERFTFHDTMDSVYSVVPMRNLPAEYLPDDYTGQSNGSTDSIIKQNISDLTEVVTRNDILFKTGSSFGIDESKKPNEQITQHFRKLNVD